MNLVWKYKINLKDQKAFSKVGELTGIDVPDELKKLILEANGASPVKSSVTINGNERIFGAVLSFNENETETDDVFTAIKIVRHKGVIPFGIDPFGNYFCYSGATKTVQYWKHEEDLFEDSKLGIDAFIHSLH